ncbi:NAD(P)-dependent oxidoreductase [Mycobacterium sp. TY814]|uniref:NAD-dependent epimerase/dehydratase family protein n=1 Tax=unclassified Mycobacterium TaxID=2642494 RepID=UPI002740FA89|nr:NAD(P)-dependent oxidoreductase [Mycobacterium sp. TY814]MDP7724003.1 NAD(P)-dependent oxidoreductase [Mycobacterium sp. TY814]
MTRIFITGANGFIGRAIWQRWNAAGHRVTGVDIAADPARGVLAGDVSRPGDWQDAAADADWVIHTAALVSNNPTLDEAWRVNVIGTRNVLDAAARGRCSRFLHLSSVRVFSDLSFPDGVGEHHPVRTDGNPYVDTRVTSEHVALQAHCAGELCVTVVRPGDVYGPGSRPWTVIPIQMIKANRFVLPAMGNGVFSPIYIEDLVEGIVAATESPAAAGQVLVLSGGVGVRCRDFFGHYYRMLGKRGPVVVPTPVALSLAHGMRAVSRITGEDSEASATSVRYLARTGTYSIAKARKLIGFQPKVALPEGMRRTRTWLATEGLI